MEVQARKNVLIKRGLNNGNEWQEPIHVEFIPDVMIVRSIAYKNDGTDPGLSFIETDLVKDQAIGIICDGVISNPNEVFEMKKAVSQNYRFRIVLSDGTTDNANGVLMVSLEFVKYK